MSKNNKMKSQTIKQILLLFVNNMMESVIKGTEERAELNNP